MTQPRHTIADLSYSEDRLECSCGAVMPAIGATAWPAHRSAEGAPHRNLGHGFRRTKPRTGSWSLGRKA